MKLSRAILKGSKGITQTTDVLYDGTGYCALGAACLGVGIQPRKGSRSSNKLHKVFPFLNRRSKNEPGTLEAEITGKNDWSGWSFKAIASWLRRQGY